ncbi:hypothetical protein M407DRAFT_73495, partial [Tulasnella calospora MUT 4182]
GHCCPSEQPSQFFRCQECFGSPILCSKCVISAHRCLPFHRVETWIDGNLDINWIPELLLEAGVFPATEKSPQTGFTIALLQHQRACNLHGKTSLKEYFDVLVQLTDSAEGQESVPVRIFQPPGAVQLTCYHVLSMFIQAGKYDGETPLRNGELCVRCPACPSPGENLPPNWRDDPLKCAHPSQHRRLNNVELN